MAKVHNWEKINKKIAGNKFESVSEAARFAEVPRRTLIDAMSRGDLPDLVVDDSQANEKEELIYSDNGNELLARFIKAEPLTEEDVVELAGIDLDEWDVTYKRINLWQIGRKNKVVNISWEDGVMDGYVNDDGQIKKSYLYQIEIKFSRKERIKVSPKLEPINLNISPYKSPEINTDPNDGILFITDPHFGFSHRDGSMVPIHNRPFLNDLMYISKQLWPRQIIWGGDILDLSEFSNYPDDPRAVRLTQSAIIESSWVLHKFAALAEASLVLEGNHDERLPRSLARNLSAAFDLKPAHELTKSSILSIPRLLAFEESEIEWIDGYPNNFVEIGDTRFIHGRVSRTGSGKTVAYMINKTSVNTIFGHIHRHESATKTNEWDGKKTTVATPGCAAIPENVPGWTMDSNWSVGAFYLNFRDNKLKTVEHISYEDDRTWFRGRYLESGTYLDEMDHDLSPEAKEIMKGVV